MCYNTGILQLKDTTARSFQINQHLPHHLSQPTHLGYIVGCQGASQLGGPCQGAHQGYKANKLKSH